MKTAIIIAAVFAAFAVAGTLDYQVAAGLSTGTHQTTLATIAGGHHAR